VPDTSHVAPNVRRTLKAGTYGLVPDDEVSQGDQAFKAGWSRLHPFDQGEVQEAVRSERPVAKPELAPFVPGYIRWQRRQSALGLAIAGPILIIVALAIALFTHAGWAALIPAGSGCGSLALRRELRRRSEEKAIAANGPSA
jgi:hypothetical protein